LRAVSTSTDCWPPFARILRSHEKPSVPGRPMSRITRSICETLSAVSACSAVGTEFGDVAFTAQLLGEAAGEDGIVFRR
jgi:hypothetical protein